ncbi:hypothetical protein DQ353_16305 [Arthrobacter sp. AQ5-05]|uniref:restriction endonuclease subunit S n=1 Tax=Arthrobacter sp. AQ5-05 TaxID=2184581 RepID=UPI000DCE823B|nr:restriction endonuclease subunit S [Arthrobacter sp. AQ5-05]RAX48247.1 hypothetical protein DQ353_16305 [Arthrobacter sp. AQ5-05]
MDHVVFVALADAGVSVLDCEHKTPARSVDGFPYIAIPDIQDGRVILESTRKISETDLKMWTRRTTPQPGDVIVTRRGRVGDTAPIPADSRCAIGQNLVLLRSDGVHVDQGFLRWAVRSPQWWTEVDRLMNVGAIFSSLNVRDIGQIRLSFPDLHMQRNIAEVLDALDDKIADNTKLAKLADELAVALSSQAFESGPELPLMELAEVTMGSSPAGTSLNEDGDGTVFYQGIRDFGLRYPERRVWTDEPGRLAQELDTLLSVRAPVGTTNIASESMCIGRGLASIRSRLGTPYTLFHAIRSSPIWQQFNSEGTVFGSINRKQLESVHLKWVDSDDLQVFETNLASLERVIRTASSTIETLTATRDALLPQLMSGKLQIKEAEDLVTAAV